MSPIAKKEHTTQERDSARRYAHLELVVTHKMCRDPYGKPRTITRLIPEWAKKKLKIKVLCLKVSGNYFRMKLAFPRERGDPRMANFCGGGFCLKAAAHVPPISTPNVCVINNRPV